MGGLALIFEKKNTTRDIFTHQLSYSATQLLAHYYFPFQMALKTLFNKKTIVDPIKSKENQFQAMRFD